MAKLYNAALMTTATTGTGTVTLGSAVTSFLTFAQAGVQDGETVSYVIEDGSNREVGRGVYTASGTTLTRSVLRSTNSNAAINLSGSARVGITAAAEDLLSIADPGGRLTLSTGTPVMASTVSASTTVYYSPYRHQFVPLYNGTSYDLHDIGGELSQTTTDTTKSPAAVTTNSNYDLFVWLDGTTYRCTRGPAWSSATSRGTGAGTTELERVKGRLLNKVAITNGPAANRGTYVGTIRTNGSSQVEWNLGGSAAGGSPGFLYVWNAYNRVSVSAMVSDSTASWTYASTTERAANNSTSFRVSFVIGFQHDGLSATYNATADGTPSSAGINMIMLDSTSSAVGARGLCAFKSAGASPGSYSAIAPLGFHYIQAGEANNVAVTTTYLGSGTGVIYTNALCVNLMM